jgi:hypothetical protein
MPAFNRETVDPIRDAFGGALISYQAECASIVGNAPQVEVNINDEFAIKQIDAPVENNLIADLRRFLSVND